MCKYFEDAGFSYPNYDNEKEGSLALNFENVLNEFRESEVWMGVSARDLEGLLAEDSRYTLFKPFINGNVYSVNGRLNSGLGNDYWESGVVYPNKVLADLVSIAHPELLPHHELIYYKKLGIGEE